MDDTLASRKRHKQACKNCRRKKSRCPGEHPVCSFCQRLDQVCEYDQVISRNNHRKSTEPSKLARRLADLEDKLSVLTDSRLGHEDNIRIDDSSDKLISPVSIQTSFPLQAQSRVFYHNDTNHVAQWMMDVEQPSSIVARDNTKSYPHNLQHSGPCSRVVCSQSPAVYHLTQILVHHPLVARQWLPCNLEPKSPLILRSAFRTCLNHTSILTKIVTTWVTSLVDAPSPLLFFTICNLCLSHRLFTYVADSTISQCSKETSRDFHLLLKQNALHVDKTLMQNLSNLLEYFCAHPEVARNLVDPDVLKVDMSDVPDFSEFLDLSCLREAVQMIRLKEKETGITKFTSGKNERKITTANFSTVSPDMTQVSSRSNSASQSQSPILMDSIVQPLSTENNPVISTQQHPSTHFTVNRTLIDQAYRSSQENLRAAQLSFSKPKTSPQRAKSTSQVLGASRPLTLNEECPKRGTSAPNLYSTGNSLMYHDTAQPLSNDASHIATHLNVYQQIDDQDVGSWQWPDKQSQQEPAQIMMDGVFQDESCLNLDPDSVAEYWARLKGRYVWTGPERMMFRPGRT